MASVQASLACLHEGVYVCECVWVCARAHSRAWHHHHCFAAPVHFWDPL